MLSLNDSELEDLLRSIPADSRDHLLEQLREHVPAAARAEEKLHEFVQMAWSIVEPTVEFSDNWHIQAICDHLQAVARGDKGMKNLLMNVPPGCGKSLLTSVFYPVWVWTWWPESRWLFASYNRERSIDFNTKRRAILKSEWYLKTWGRLFQLDKSEDLKTRFKNSKRGEMVTSGIGQALGSHPDFIVCLPYYAKVMTREGEKPIGWIVQNEVECEVLSENGWSKLKGWHENGVQEIWRISFSDGSHLDLTGNHQVKTQKGWQEAWNLEFPAYVLNSSGRYQNAVSVNPIGRSEIVYDITTEHGNFFADGYCVHNCDDPNDEKDIPYEAKRKVVLNWWNGSIASRGILRNSRRIVIQQRLCPEDLSGHILDNWNDEWTHMCLPYRYEENRMPNTPLGWNDPREVGEVLWKSMEEKYNSLEKSLPPHTAAGQLQQRPTSEEGDIFRKDWFHVVERKDCPFYTDPSKKKMCRVVRYWDRAGTEGAGAFTVGVLLCRYFDTYWVLNVVRGQWAQHKRDMIIQETSAEDAREWPDYTVWGEIEPGSAGKDVHSLFVTMLAGYRVYGDKVTVNKTLRADPWAAQLAGGNVKLVKSRFNWWDAYISEHLQFPLGKYVDQVDASSGAFLKLCKKPVGRISRELLMVESDDAEKQQEASRWKSSMFSDWRN